MLQVILRRLSFKWYFSLFIDVPGRNVTKEQPGEKNTVEVIMFRPT